MKKLLIVILAVFFGGFLQAEDVPRVAVIPFEAIGVSDSDALVISNLFETGLVNTNKFNVIEQNQIKDILEAQAFSLSGCTDDACAVEVGQLLSAEQIALGSVSKIGDKYILTAKLIDVELGRNIQAVDVQADSISDMPDKAKLLAFSLAGLTYSSGQSLTIAEKFGEIYISTTPSEADIYINGIKRGKSPDVFNQIPIGEVLFEARSGNLYASNTIKITERMQEIELELEVVQGNLFIKSTDNNVKVLLDGNNYGLLNTGLIKNLPVGTFNMELIGKGVYYSQKVEIKEGETTKIEANPFSVGELQYKIPTGAFAKLVSETNEKYGLTDDGVIERLPIGTYTIKIEGTNYKDFDETILIEKAKIVQFEPKLEYVEEYQIKIQHEKWKKEILSFQDAAKYIEKKFSDTDKLIDFYAQIDNFIEEIDSSEYTDTIILQSAIGIKDDIETKYTEYKISILSANLINLQKDKRTAEGAQRSKGVFRTIMFGSSIGSFGLMGTSIFFAEQAYSNYQISTITAETSLYRSDVEMWDTISIISGVAGGLAALTGFIFGYSKNNPIDYDSEIQKTEDEIMLLQSSRSYAID